jgi:hypothetical protein
MALAAHQSAAACSAQLPIPASQAENALKAVATMLFAPDEHLLVDVGHGME